MILRLLFVTMLSLFAGTAHAQTEAIGDALAQYLADQNIDGASFLANLNGKKISVVEGTIDEAQEMQTKNDTRFYIASTGKMMTAAAILSMVEEGKLQLDDPIWPNIKSIAGIEELKNADKITLRQLLNHTSGLAEYLNEKFDDASTETPSKRWSAAEAVAFAFGAKPVFAPGSSFEYTNTNYVLLGYILENVDGSIENALQKRVFDKAGMSNTNVGANPDEKGLARGFDEDGNDASEQAWASELGDGPAVSTATDVAKFMQALFVDKSILGADMLTQMLKGSKHDEGYGLGMGVDGDDYGPWYGHAGSYGGYEADVRYYKKQKAVFVVLMNGNPSDEEDVFLDIATNIVWGN
ncbi:serine hydrolase domain-containing protein [Maritalea sp.]|uniref:serine hydrolase domain-containing protein n=1 Tax=Maritalea sp. TaxID=2003361 RepID=UPI003EF9EA56